MHLKVPPRFFRMHDVIQKYNPTQRLEYAKRMEKFFYIRFIVVRTKEIIKDTLLQSAKIRLLLFLNYNDRIYDDSAKACLTEEKEDDVEVLSDFLYFMVIFIINYSFQFILFIIVYIFLYIFYILPYL